MKISVEFLGMPAMTETVGKKTAIDLSGSTVADLIGHLSGLLVRRGGPKASRFLLEEDGSLDPIIQVMVNEEGFLPRDVFGKRTLREGDQVRFLLLAGGG